MNRQMSHEPFKLSRLEFEAYLTNQICMERPGSRLSCINHTNAFLKALLITNLSLAIPTLEIYWGIYSDTEDLVGLATFNSVPLPLCQCDAVINPKRVPAWVWSGQYWIRRHDTLHDIIYHALLIDNNSNVRVIFMETTLDRPGDCFILIIRIEKPRTWPLRCYKLCFCEHWHSGYARRGGEDDKHATNVWMVGDDFVPLIVET